MTDTAPNPRKLKVGDLFGAAYDDEKTGVCRMACVVLDVKDGVIKADVINGRSSLFFDAESGELRNHPFEFAGSITFTGEFPEEITKGLKNLQEKLLPYGGSAGSQMNEADYALMEQVCDFLAEQDGVVSMDNAPRMVM